MNNNFPKTAIEAWHMAKGRIKILLVISQPIDESEKVSYLEEVVEIIDQLESTKVSATIIRLNPPTFENLQKTLNYSFEIVHFIGHSRMDSIQLEKRDGTSDWVSYEKLAELFTGAKTQLVVLNNCYSEKLGREITFEGIPAVITSSWKVQSDSARMFSGTFYASLLSGSTPNYAASAVNLTQRLTENRALGLNNKVSAFGTKVDESIFDFKYNFDGPYYYTCEPIHSPQFRLKKSVFGRVDSFLKIFKNFNSIDFPLFGVVGLGGYGKTTTILAAAWHYRWLFKGGMVYISLRQLGPFNLNTVFKEFEWGLEGKSAVEQKQIVIERISKSSFLLVVDDIEVGTREDLGELKSIIESWDNSLGGKAILIGRNIPPDTLKIFEGFITPNLLKIEELSNNDSNELFMSLIGENEKYLYELRDDISLIPSICYNHPIIIEHAAVSLLMGNPWKETLANLKKLGNIDQRINEMIKGTISKLIENAPVTRAFLDTWGAFKEIAVEEGWQFVVSGKVKHQLNEAELNRHALALKGLRDSMILSITQEGGERLCTLHPLISTFVKHNYWNHLSSIIRSDYEDLHFDFYLNEIKDNFENNYSFASNWGNITLAFERARTSNKWNRIINAVLIIAGSEKSQLIKRGFENYSEWVILFGIEGAKKIEDFPSFGNFCYRLGLAKYNLAKYEESQYFLQEALRISEINRLLELQINTLIELGRLDYRKGYFEEGKKKYEIALKMVGGLDDENKKANLNHQLGKIAFKSGYFDDAERLFRDALTYRKKVTDYKGIAKSLHELARVFHYRQPPNYLKARDFYLMSLDTKRTKIANVQLQLSDSRFKKSDDIKY